MRTPTGKKYNYCGPGTKLEERLASNEPKYRDPINNLDSICQKHDIDYSNRFLTFYLLSFYMMYFYFYIVIYIFLFTGPL